MSADADSHAGSPVAPAGRGMGSRTKSTTARSILSAAVYSGGLAIQRALGLITLPLYTAVLTPAQYGSIGLLTAGYMAAVLLFGFGLETVILRNYFQFADQPARRDEFLHSLWRFLVAFPIVAGFALGLLSWVAVRPSMPIEGFDAFLMLIAAGVNVGATTLPMAVLRARQDIRGYVWITGAATVFTTALTILFVVVLRDGARGWFLALLVANLLVLVTAIAVVPWHRAARFRWPPVRDALRFSAPLLPHSVSHWALQVSDRAIIAGLVTATALGLYSLASNLAASAMVLVMALNQAFSPTYARVGAGGGSRAELSRVVVLQVAGVTLVTLGGCLVGPSLLEVLTPPDFHGAAGLLPWLILGYGLLGLYFIPMNGATLAAGRRTFAWLATAASAGVNLGLVLLLVPEHGVHAAAVASALGYAVLLVLILLWAHARPNPVVYDARRIGTIVLIAVIAYVGGRATAPNASGLAMATGSAWTVAFCVAVGTLLFPSRARGLFRRA